MVVDTLRAHRVAVLAWSVGGAAAMYLTALSLIGEMREFPGGAAGLAASVTPAAEAMRLLRWPAERLDTLGGYLTYHNVTLITLFLCVYAVVVGARAGRGGETDSSTEEVLATGWSRAAVIRDRALGFLVMLAVIVVGVGLGVAAGMWAGDAPDVIGSLVTTAASALAAFAAYALAVLVAQLVASPRAAAGLSALVIVALYVLTNVWERLGPLGAVRFVSPFYYALQSRALVPGHGLDVAAVAALATAAAVLLALAGWAFGARDYGGTVWSRRPATAASATARTWSPSPALRAVWTATLARGRLGLLVWSASMAAWIALIVWMEPAVLEVWDSFGFTAALAGGSPEEQYLGFVGELLVPVIAAFVVTQAAGWLDDLDAGRVEAVLAAPVSWTRLVWERWLATTVAVGVITVVALLTITVGGQVIGTAASVDGLARLGAVCVLFGAAVAAVASILVVGLRSGVALTVLAVYLGMSYLLTLLVPMLDWPEWLSRLSVLWAFGHPYLEWPAAAGLALLLTLAGPGTLLAAGVAERTPKCA